MWNQLLDAMAWAIQTFGWAGVSIVAAAAIYILVTDTRAANASRPSPRDEAIGRDQARQERKARLLRLQQRVAGRDPRRW